MEQVPKSSFYYCCCLRPSQVLRKSGWESTGAVDLTTLSALCRNTCTHTINLSMAISSLSEDFHLSLFKALVGSYILFSRVSFPDSHICSPKSFLLLWNCHSVFFSLVPRLLGTVAKYQEVDLVIHSFTQQILTEQISTMRGEPFVGKRQARHGGS